MAHFITAAKALAPVIAFVIALTAVALAMLVANARDRRNPFALSPDVQADREAHLKRAWGDEVMDERQGDEAFCATCPDHEACMTGWPCSLVKRLALGESA